jgi:large subunit ribosomal protein L18
MNHEKFIRQQRMRRRQRVRRRLRGTSDRPRLSVTRSHKHVYSQIIDDTNGRTIVSASTRDKELRDEVARGGNKDAAAAVGAALARKASAAGIKNVRFDRGAYRYHGRVAALAEAVRAGGINL